MEKHITVFSANLKTSAELNVYILYDILTGIRLSLLNGLANTLIKKVWLYGFKMMETKRVKIKSFYQRSPFQKKKNYTFNYC